MSYDNEKITHDTPIYYDNEKITHDTPIYYDNEEITPDTPIYYDAVQYKFSDNEITTKYGSNNILLINSDIVVYKMKNKPGYYAIDRDQLDMQMKTPEYIWFLCKNRINDKQMDMQDIFTRDYSYFTNNHNVLPIEYIKFHIPYTFFVEASQIRLFLDENVSPDIFWEIEIVNDYDGKRLTYPGIKSSDSIGNVLEHHEDYQNKWCNDDRRYNIGTITTFTPKIMLNDSSVKLDENDQLFIQDRIKKLEEAKNASLTQYYLDTSDRFIKYNAEIEEEKKRRDQKHYAKIKEKQFILQKIESVRQALEDEYVTRYSRTTQEQSPELQEEMRKIETEGREIEKKAQQQYQELIRQFSEEYKETQEENTKLNDEMLKINSLTEIDLILKQPLEIQEKLRELRKKIMDINEEEVIRGQIKEIKNQQYLKLIREQPQEIQKAMQEIEAERQEIKEKKEQQQERSKLLLKRKLDLQKRNSEITKIKKIENKMQQLRKRKLDLQKRNLEIKEIEEKIQQEYQIVVRRQREDIQQALQKIEADRQQPSQRVRELQQALQEIEEEIQEIEKERQQRYQELIPRDPQEIQQALQKIEEERQQQPQHYGGAPRKKTRHNNISTKAKKNAKTQKSRKHTTTARKPKISSRQKINTARAPARKRTTTTQPPTRKQTIRVQKPTISSSQKINTSRTRPK